jgi:hypothetical protein
MPPPGRANPARNRRLFRIQDHRPRRAPLERPPRGSRCADAGRVLGALGARSMG